MTIESERTHEASAVVDACYQASCAAKCLIGASLTRDWLHIERDIGPAIWRLHPAARARLAEELSGTVYEPLDNKLFEWPIEEDEAAKFELAILLAGGGEVTISPLGEEWATHYVEGSQLLLRDCRPPARHAWAWKEAALAASEMITAMRDGPGGLSLPRPERDRVMAARERLEKLGELP